jgi:flagellar P-ring protein precursor FlgI
MRSLYLYAVFLCLYPLNAKEIEKKQDKIKKITDLVDLQKKKITRMTRLKDVMVLQEQRDNYLVGYGLVMGLNGDGDHGCPPTLESYVSMLERMGINIRKDIEKTKPRNIAAVMVIAKLSSFVAAGSTIPVEVASAGNAKSLRGGILLPTPLVGADGKIYVVAQGSIVVGGYRVNGQNGSYTQQNISTRGSIANGGLVERSVENVKPKDSILNFRLKNPDWTTVHRILDVLKIEGGCHAVACDHANIRVHVPQKFSQNIPGFMAQIEQLKITPDHLAQIIINERTGSIVISSYVRILPCIIAKGDMKIIVREHKDILKNYKKDHNKIQMPLPWPNHLSDGNEHGLTSRQLSHPLPIKNLNILGHNNNSYYGQPYKHPTSQHKQQHEMYHERLESFDSDIDIEQNAHSSKNFFYVPEQSNDLRHLVDILESTGMPSEQIIQLIIDINKAGLIVGEVISL